MTYFARDFANFDRSEALSPFIQCLELQQSLPFYQYYIRQFLTIQDREEDKDSGASNSVTEGLLKSQNSLN